MKLFRFLFRKKPQDFLRPWQAKYNDAMIERRRGIERDAKAWRDSQKKDPAV
jgi:hypothetical protein